MTEADGFEQRLASSLIRDADEAIPTFDPAAVARAAIARRRFDGDRPAWRRPSGRAASLLAAAALVAIGVAATIVPPRAPSTGAPSDSTGTSPGPTATAGATEPLGTWVATAPMTTARSSGLIAVALLDGRVLVAGGDAGLRSSELYDPRTGSWRPAGDMMEPRLAPTVTRLLDGRVLVVGGSGRRSMSPTDGTVVFPSTLASAELYDPATGAWTATGSMGQARTGHTATLLPDGRVLVAGGAAPESVPYPRLASTELYDPVAGTWTAGPMLVEARDGHTATLLPDGRVLVVGGWNGGRLAATEIFDPRGGSWTAAAGLPEAFGGHAATLLPDGTLLITGGDRPQGGGAVGSPHAARYDPAVGTWSLTKAMLTGRLAHMATLLPSGDVLVTGGQPDGGLDSEPFGSAELYAPPSAAWTAIAPMSFGRAGHGAVLLLDGRLLVVGGASGADGASAELFIR